MVAAGKMCSDPRREILATNVGAYTARAKSESAQWNFYEELQVDLRVYFTNNLCMNTGYYKVWNMKQLNCSHLIQSTLYDCITFLMSKLNLYSLQLKLKYLTHYPYPTHWAQKPYEECKNKRSDEVWNMKHFNCNLLPKHLASKYRFIEIT